MSELPLLQAALALLTLGALLAGLWVAEHFWSLREWTRSSWQRTQTHVLVGGPHLLVALLVLLPLLVATAVVGKELNFGLVRWLPFPLPWKSVIAFLVIDYSLYLWHRATHRVPWLWRFHRVHHTDHDLSLTTAFRFHVGETVCSIPFRVAAVAISGADVIVVLVYELVLHSCVAFHHSNWDISRGFDRFLQRFLMTPRLHGIHHSNRKRETDSNFSSVLTLWDQLHRTFLSSVRQTSIAIGAPDGRVSPIESASQLLRAPFVTHQDLVSGPTHSTQRPTQQTSRPTHSTQGRTQATQRGL